MIDSCLILKARIFTSIRQTVLKNESVNMYKKANRKGMKSMTEDQSAINKKQLHLENLKKNCIHLIEESL